MMEVARHKGRITLAVFRPNPFGQTITEANDVLSSGGEIADV